MMHFAVGGPNAEVTLEQAKALLECALAGMGELRRVLIVPPDFTRAHSWAGELTCLLCNLLPADCEVVIIPALGTHSPMTPKQIGIMFPGIPAERFRAHRWREDTVPVGIVTPEFISVVSGGRVDYSIDCQVNRALVEEQWDAIFSVGQLVPHEVVGIANHNKNIVVGLGGKDTIDKSHFLGAVCGMESIMGRPDSPVRATFDHMEGAFLPHVPITYLLTVRASNDAGHLVTRGLYCGTGKDPYIAGAPLAAEVNIKWLEEPIHRAVVWLDPAEFKSTWLGNKAIYRLRMAMADDGELIILGPGVREFGEDPAIDTLIRRHGYCGTPAVLERIREDEELAGNLSAAAHLIHGSSEGRFRITWCAGGLTEKEIRDAGFEFAPWEDVRRSVDFDALKTGMNSVNGESIFFVPNPALGLWSTRERFSGGTA